MNSVKFYVQGKLFTFLVDTGTSLSAIKYDAISSLREFIKPITTNINGIGDTITSIGYVRRNLYNESNDSFIHNFHVFQTLLVNVHGILGQNFLEKQFFQQNFENYTFILNKNKRFNILPLNVYSISNSKSQSCIKLPSRSESILSVQTNIIGDFVVVSNEISEGIFVANLISKSVNGRIAVKVMNTREEKVILNCFTPEIKRFDDFDCYNFEECQNSAERVKTLFLLLNLSYLNKEEETSIANICAKFTDVFHLPGDKLNTMNLYEQEMHINPNTAPVYCKLYRLPYYQKAEI